MRLKSESKEGPNINLRSAFRKRKIGVSGMLNLLYCSSNRNEPTSAYSTSLPEPSLSYAVRVQVPTCANNKSRTVPEFMSLCLVACVLNCRPKSLGLIHVKGFFTDYRFLTFYVSFSYILIPTHWTRLANIVPQEKAEKNSLL